MFTRLLVANRGEIAVRVMRACRELGISTVAVHSAAEALSPHVLAADSAVCIGGPTAAESYLDAAAVIAAAVAQGADAVHPGYGFLSENADFAQGCADAGLVFVGPTPEAIRVMGDKTTARAAAAAAGVPMLPGSDGAVDPADIPDVADRIGFPVVVKAAFGGGGRGMRVVTDPDRLVEAAASAAREATGAFGRPEVFVERYLPDARHLEVQVLGDAHGTVIAVGDRDCTVQRRHQKLMEEAPAPDLPDAVRNGIRDASVALATAVGYRGAGTVEFLYSPGTEEFFFLEMNTRLQVEHGVTELVTGIDLVHEQLRIGAGEPLRYAQADVRVTGHAIQARISAEDPWAGFLPRTGLIERCVLPVAPWVRTDFGVVTGSTVHPYYDSMIGKVMAWGPTRAEAADRLRLALGDLVVEGVATTAPYLAALLALPDHRDMNYSTDTVGERWDPAGFPPPAAAPAGPAAPVTPAPAGPVRRDVVIETDRGPLTLTVWGAAGRAGTDTTARSGSGRKAGGGTSAGGGKEPLAPMDATVIRVDVAAGDEVEQGAVLAVLEAMKMEMPVTAGRSGTVAEILVTVGQTVATGQRIAVLAG
ncbi:ATP-grasp domain-containing protein [Nakamurella sp. YIM 132087]|uniref:biotin carboxylase n=1 Tax=Nakamurella alba TaxID=2665158 RepID=A0A7K1FH47_9ACTN|nr:biotin carboxylase N-terminal domain-containing protein [Nakamurella alba]MTD13428.1 ATP-grasp domain-containing protein [Nakamurella alba]